MRLDRNNWFLVIPTIVLGVAATVTLYRMHGAGDVRTALQVVTGYQAEGRLPLGEYVAAGAERVDWDAEVVSSFYGTMDVTCRVGEPESVDYRWRVDVVRHAFAPADEPTKALMKEYDPEIFAAGGSGGARGEQRP